MIGIFGGRFDPVHRAHIAMARAAADQLSLQEVLWVVSANAVHKSTEASAEHRLAMVELALKDLNDPRMRLDEREVHAAARGEDNPSHKTLESLKRERPKEEWVWILGEDQLAAFTSWQRWEWLVQNMALAVCERGEGRSMANTPSGARILRVAFAPDAVSSSQVRDVVAGGLAADTLVPKVVADYISVNGLYRSK